MRNILAATAIFAATLAHAETVTFPAADGVEITADTGGSGSTVIALFHMAGASRGEYAEIAPRLHALGYRTLAVDQRSGGSFGGVSNETARRAGNGDYLAAIPDIEAAMAYARGTMGATHVGALGSSYSASLVLILAGRDPGFADAVMAFSPGEYFLDADLAVRTAADIHIPAFITSARGEQAQWQAILDAIPSDATGFVPDGDGQHGATALLTPAGPEYWQALEAFLAAHLPASH